MKYVTNAPDMHSEGNVDLIHHKRSDSIILEIMGVDERSGLPVIGIIAFRKKLAPKMLKDLRNGSGTTAGSVKQVLVVFTIGGIIDFTDIASFEIKPRTGAYAGHYWLNFLGNFKGVRLYLGLCPNRKAQLEYFLEDICFDLRMENAA